MRTESNNDAGGLFRAHARFIRAFLIKNRMPISQVDDLVQDVFIIAHTLGGYVPGPATARTWLCAIALRVAANARRAYTRLDKHTRDYYITVTSIPIIHSHDYFTDQHRDMLRVKTTLNSMVPIHRDVFVRFILNGESCAEISKNLDIPIGTVYSRLHAARDRFNVLFNKTDLIQ